jgi:hypothetical protein
MRSFIVCTHLQISLSSLVKANEVGRACSTRVKGQKSVQGFGGKAQGKRPLGRPRSRWVDGIRMHPR